MVLSKNARRFVVLGGAGAIGRVVVRDLYESNPRNHILAADFDESAAGLLARTFHSRRVAHSFADARYPARLAAMIDGHQVVINCTRHELNLNVMEAALLARAHYIDLGGLFVWTRRQLRLHRPFAEAGLTAILGMGCAPGLTNVMAAAAAAQLDRVDSIRIRVGGIDFKGRNNGFAFPYSAQTIVEELTLSPWKWSGGRFVQVKPLTGWERVDFGGPVGRVWTVMTRHSEIATLPLRFREKGLRYADFKMGFDRIFVRELTKRLRAGWTIHDFQGLPAPRTAADDYEIARIIVRGGKQTIVMECHARSNSGWRASAGDVDTACPASIGAQMVAAGAIRQPGVWAPEDVVEPEALFRELRQRGLAIRLLH